MITETCKVTVGSGLDLYLDILESGKNKWLILTHGLGEHCKRHKYLFDLFSEHYNICLYDLRGHGCSGGERGFVNRFEDYSADLTEVIKYLIDEYSMSEYVLLGHSMGGLIVSDFMQNFVSKLNIAPKKVFLSSPAVSGAGTLGSFFNIVPNSFIDKLSSLPSLRLSGVLDLSRLSHDPRVYESYITDDLNLLKLHTKLMLEVISRGKEVYSRPLNIACELYCAYGALDGLVDSDRIKNYFENYEPKAVVFRVEGGYHELHNEVEKYRGPYLQFLKDSLVS